MKKDAHLFNVRPATAWLTDTTRASNLGGAKNFRGENPTRGAAISYYLKGVPAGDVKITISDVMGTVVRTFNPCTDTVDGELRSEAGGRQPRPMEPGP